ncbi:MAG: hypothetical protein M1544_03860 [Candidatus Marsarchaeota archaeon]|nr:hypothetical protein [Candidatus Marsarchaeota archaeon]
MPKFIVSSTRNAPNNMQFCTLFGKVPVQLYSSAIAEPLDIVELSGQDYSDSIKASNITGLKATKEEYLKGLQSSLQGVKPGKIKKLGINPLDSAINAMSGKIGEIAESITASFVAGAPIMFRFHNDGDGTSGAIAIYRALEKLAKELRFDTSNCLWTMNKGVAYTMQSLEYDRLRFSQYNSVMKPLLCIIDFGSVGESSSALKRASGSIDAILIDHHPVQEDFDPSISKHYLNPWLEGFTSDVTAGALACEIAAVISNAKIKELVGASLISDHSEYAQDDKAQVKLASVLDAITTEASYRSANVNPKSIVAIMEDKPKYERIFSEANEQMEEALATGMRHAKPRKVAGITLAVLDYSSISDNRYPYVRHGRFTSIFSDRVEQKYGPSITVVYNKSLYSIRVSKELSEKLALLSLISKMKEETDYITNGGGHNEAASIKLDDEFSAGEFTNIFIKEIESRLSA